MSRPWSSSVSKEIQGKEILIPEKRNAALVAAMTAFVRGRYRMRVHHGRDHRTASEQAVQLATPEEDPTAGRALLHRDAATLETDHSGAALGTLQHGVGHCVPHSPERPTGRAFMPRAPARIPRAAKSSQANTAIVAVFTLGWRVFCLEMVS
jgi:hypothetical protein